jgi:hypothetical protein
MQFACSNRKKCRIKQSKGAIKEIIISFHYLIQNINIDGLIGLFCRINTILMQCLKFNVYVYLAQN